MEKHVFEFECDCGGKTEVSFQKPGTFVTTYREVSCNECGSTFEMRFRDTPKGIATSHRLTHGSRKLGEVLRAREFNKMVNRPVEKPKIIRLPGFRQ